MTNNFLVNKSTRKIERGHEEQRKTRRVRSLKRKKRIESKIESVLLQGTNEKVVNHSLQEIRNSLPSESSSCWCLHFKKALFKVKCFLTK